jgi:hypothetical protein
MKTLKLAMIGIIVAVTIVGVANAGPITDINNKVTGKAINLTLQQAVSDLDLVAAIVQQVTLDDVLKSPSNIYVAKVIYKNQTYLISGGRDQWILFFKFVGEWKSGVSSNTVHVF